MRETFSGILSRAARVVESKSASRALHHEAESLVHRAVNPQRSESSDVFSVPHELHSRLE
jgi:hypothetical protein